MSLESTSLLEFPNNNAQKALHEKGFKIEGIYSLQRKVLSLLVSVGLFLLNFLIEFPSFSHFYTLQPAPFCFLKRTRMMTGGA